MLHARNHFLADIAALGEIDAAELVHVGLVREGVAVAEIDAAVRDAERDAVRFVFAGLDNRRAKLGGRLGGAMRRQHDAQPECGQARIGVAEADAGRAVAIPCRQHAKDLGQIFDDHASAQLVEVELVDHRFGERARDVEEEAAAIARRRLSNDEIRDDLALRRQ